MANANVTSTTFTESQRFARGGTINTLLGGTGRTGQVIKNLGRAEIGSTGQALDELKDQLGQYSDILRLDDRFETIKNSLKLVTNLRYMNMPTMAAVIIFMHKSGTLTVQVGQVQNHNGDIIEIFGPKPEYFQDNLSEQSPFDIVYTRLKSNLDDKNITDLDLDEIDIYNPSEIMDMNPRSAEQIKLKFKEMFLRYIRTLYKTFGTTDLRTRI